MASFRTMSTDDDHGTTESLWDYLAEEDFVRAIKKSATK